MAVPGYEGIGRVGFSDKGDYSAGKVYKAGDVVFSEGSSYLALKDNLQGVKPQNDGENWRFMARGFGAELLSGVMALDQSGLIGSTGESVNAQDLMDAIADKVATKLLLKTDVVNQIVNDANKAASAAALYSVKQTVDEVNSDKANISDMNANIRESSFYVLEDASQRDINNAPSWYVENHPQRLVMEFKRATSIGLSGQFLSIFTITPWTDTSGGYPTQFAVRNGAVYVRAARDVSTWGDWAEK